MIVRARRLLDRTRVEPFPAQVVVLSAVYIPLLALLVCARWVLGLRAGDVITPLSTNVGRAIEHSSFQLLTVGLWAVALGGGVVGLLAARGRPRGGRAALTERFFGSAVLLSALFLLDDAFQLHKPTLPESTGLPSWAFLTLYAVAVVAWLAGHWRRIERSEVLILATTMGFFAVWALYKAGAHLPFTTPVEISAKLCGAAGWAVYMLWAASSERHRMRRSAIVGGSGTPGP